MRQAMVILAGALAAVLPRAARADLCLTLLTSFEPSAFATAGFGDAAADSSAPSSCASRRCAVTTLGPLSSMAAARDPVSADDRFFRLLEWGDDEPSVEPWLSLVGPGTSTVLVPDEAPALRELPAVPGSGMLTITGLVPLGAWQVLRSVRRVHLGGLPAWYHPSAPHRIGCAVAYDFDQHLLSLCVFDSVCEPDGPHHGPPVFTHRDTLRRPGSPYSLPVTAPRGPPRAF